MTARGLISSMPAVLLSLRVVTAWNEGRRGLSLAARMFATPRSRLSSGADRYRRRDRSIFEIAHGGEQFARQAQGNMARHDNAVGARLHSNIVASGSDVRRIFNPVIQDNPRSIAFSVREKPAGTWLTKSLSLLVFQRFRGS
ncbi:hypothetical protein SPHS6_00384 [Sphingobium sp. S6]|nr:hypothetical protein SPHS8_00384 [Sphingobium sp. S8]CAD7335212.1 hypothetical protein SPHS6_00384 [Sphingobium sp. S6]CAD7335291.1 hypothetical protein SPHS8_00433 [Sphingobium sp. S8]